ncbi:MAG: phosphotransferase family protein, partial [Ardenticatenaceae bacterium]
QVDLDRVARNVAEFLVALHAYPVGEAPQLGNLEPKNVEVLGQEAIPLLRTHLSESEYETITSWWKWYPTDATKEYFHPKLIHGDLWCENIILNETLDRVVGVVDWESVATGDVAWDFVAQKYVGNAFLSQVIGHYQTLGGELGNNFDARLRGLSLLRELGGFLYAVRHPESGELEDALQKIRDEIRLIDGLTVTKISD